MTNKAITFLEKIGHDFEIGLVKIDPIIHVVVTLASVALPEVAAINPAMGALLSTVIGVVVNIEQKFTAMNKQMGSGPEKLATAVTILNPIVTQIFTEAGKPADMVTVQKYISAVVGVLNQLPAGILDGTVPLPVVTHPTA